MADNVAITPGTGVSIASDEVGGAQHQRVKISLGADGTANDAEAGAGAVGTGTQRVTLGSDDPGVTSLAIIDDWDDNDACSSVNPMDVITTSITRPANTTAYTANDVWAATTADSGGSTFTSAARASGGTGIITGAVITSSNDGPSTKLEGEIWIFDTSVTEVADNAAFTLSDTDVDKLMCVIPFTLAEASANNDYAVVSDLSHIYKCVGSANLRFMVKVKNAYTPASGEILTVRLKVLQG